VFKQTCTNISRTSTGLNRTERGRRYGLLDRTPQGRHEEGEPEFWLRRHDEYEHAVANPKEGTR
jgi:predicted dithiol-disulfide oxidoreductase (DUF899 family)